MKKAEIRKTVYEKYGGHCAYCGRKISIEEMQVDHIKPKRMGGDDGTGNLNPSCRLCNHYKRANCIETFRNWSLGWLVKRLEKHYLFRVAVAFHMVEVKGWDGKFYYEKYEDKSKDDSVE